MWLEKLVYDLMYFFPDRKKKGKILSNIAEAERRIKNYGDNGEVRYCKINVTFIY